MADLTTSGSYFPIYDNSGVGIGRAKLGANNYKVVETNKMGTRDIVYLQVAAVEDSSAVDFTKAVLAGTGTYTDNGSLMQKAINALQGFAEAYFVGIPSATEFTVVVAIDTANSGASNVSNGTYSDMEAAIKAACGIGTGTNSVTVTPLKLSGNTLVSV